MLTLGMSFLLSTLLGAAMGLNLVTARRYRSTILIASPVLGIGAAALLYFLWILAFNPRYATPLYITLEVLLAGGGFALFWWRERRHAHVEPVLSGVRTSQLRELNVWKIILVALVTLSLFRFLVIFIDNQATKPVGEWDAWAIWNMRARYLFMGAEQWRNAFTTFLHGSDYPVLISFYSARVWSMIGTANPAAPQLQALIFALTTAGLLFDSLRRNRGMFQGLLVATVLLVTPSFIRWSAAQYADIPLGVYFLLTGILLFDYLYQDNESVQTSATMKLNIPPPGLAALAGVCAGFALWTKNEGLFILVGVLMAQALLVIFSAERRIYFRAWIYFWTGTLPALFTYVVFKLFVAPPNYALAQTIEGMVEKWFDGTRRQTVAFYMKKKLLAFGDWVVPLLPMLLVYGLLVGVDIPSIRRSYRGLIFLAIVILTVLGMFIVAYLVTTLPLEWQIRKSLERLLLQVYPLFLLLLFSILRDPTTKRE